jgi:nucleotide-binding universal stress UspA family protein
MTYRSLLTLLDQDSLCGIRTDVAIRLAKDLDCHLVGVAPTGLIYVPMAPEAAASLTRYAELAWDELRQRAQEATRRFGDECRAKGVKSFEAVIDESDKARSLVQHAHCSDLTVLTQPDPAAPDHGLVRELVEQVVLYSARPTLILPYAGRFDTLGTSAVVAWDDSREAARALSDALPLLRRAASVRIVSWSESGTNDDAVGRPRLDALRRWLMWQGVMADVHIEPGQLDIADAMLSSTADLGADLIVMGAYGHTRWRERLLGGATRGVLASMTVPVLMSH